MERRIKHTNTCTLESPFRNCGSLKLAHLQSTFPWEFQQGHFHEKLFFLRLTFSNRLKAFTSLLAWCYKISKRLFKRGSHLDTQAQGSIKSSRIPERKASVEWLPEAHLQPRRLKVTKQALLAETCPRWAAVLCTVPWKTLNKEDKLLSHGFSGLWHLLNARCNRYFCSTQVQEKKKKPRNLQDKKKA